MENNGSSGKKHGVTFNQNEAKTLSVYAAIEGRRGVLCAGGFY